jgi:hypothetical protein
MFDFECFVYWSILDMRGKQMKLFWALKKTGYLSRGRRGLVFYTNNEKVKRKIMLVSYLKLPSLFL